ncbi:MAG TPA: hypothetical protein VJ617_12145 [Arthrobacter sp.]|nr:hypothetical protein [Arthrobacter sp.]
MIDASELNIQITLSIKELRNLVALLNLAAEQFEDDHEVPEEVGVISGLYFDLMKNLQDGYLGEFSPEQ